MSTLARVARRWRSSSWPDSLESFAFELIRPKGRAFSFEGREYLREIYADESRRLVLMKAAQTGGSLCMVTRLFWFASPHGGGWHGGYYLDTRDRMQDFVQGYLRDLLNESPQLARGVTGELSPVTGKKGADNTRMLHFCGVPLYFRSMQVMGEVKSLPLDVLMLDEEEELGRPLVRELDLSVVDLAEDRLMASEFNYAARISQPGMVGYGIHRDFLNSDGKVWMHRCTRGHWSDLASCFPECLGEQEIICCDCGATLYDWDGTRKRFLGEKREWVAARPGHEVSGYLLSQLFAPMTSPAYIHDEWKKARGNPSKEARVSISILGHPAASNLQPLSREIIEKAGDRERAIPEISEEMTYAAVDVGDLLWWAAGRAVGSGVEILDFGCTQSEIEVTERLRRLNAAVAVDIRPEHRLARRLVRACGQGVLCEFGSVERPVLREDIFLDEDGTQRALPIAKVDRDKMIDQVVAAFLGENLSIPSRAPAWRFMVDHCQALVKRKDARTGKESYVKGVENHLGFTLGYLLLLLRLRDDLRLAAGPVESTLMVGGRRVREWW